MTYWPLTLRGSLVFLAALTLMGTALPLSNPYGIILSTLLLVYLFLSTGYIIFFRFRINGDKFKWSHRSGTAPWLTGEGEKSRGRDHIFLSMDAALPLLTIYHFTLTGKLYGGDKSLYGQRKSLAFTSRINTALELPLPGIFHGRGRLYLSDLFGFIRTPLTDWQHREIYLYPPLLGELEIPRPSSAEESEETVRTSPSNPERVFMRDYQPGDLARDINWKASGKFTAIYTRIAPDAADTTTRLTVVLRTNGLAEAGEPYRSALLLGLKSFSLTLIGRLLRDYPESIIVVQAGGQTFSTENEPLAERAIPHIVALGWNQGEPPGETVLPEGGALVCTTTADKERVLLNKISPTGLYVICAGPAKKTGRDSASGTAPGTAPPDNDTSGDLTFSLFRGNALPMGNLIRAFKPEQLGIIKRKNHLPPSKRSLSSSDEGKEEFALKVEVVL